LQGLQAPHAVSVCACFPHAQKEAPMTYARVFQSGNSQAVRLPKEFRANAR